MRRTALAAAALLLAACGGAGEVALGDAPITEDEARRIVTTADIEAVGGDTGGIEQTVEDRRAYMELVNPDSVAEIRGAFIISFAKGPVGSAVIVAVSDLASSEIANRAFDLFESGLAFEPLEPPIGERSRGGETTIGGAMVFFMAGQRLVNMQTTQLAEEDAILTAEQLEALARRIAPRF